MRDERGLTLIELLVAIVITGIIIIPLLTIMTGTFTRTLSQEKGTQNAYIAQELIEKVMNDHNSLDMNEYCWSPVNRSCDSFEPLPAPYNELSTDEEDVIVYVLIEKYDEHEGIDHFHRVTVTVKTESATRENNNEIQLVTVVRDSKL